MATGPCVLKDGTQSCNDAKPATAAEGLTGIGVGLVIGLVGVLIIASGPQSESSSSSATPDAFDPPAAPPTVLERNQAIGMAVAELTLEGVGGAKLVSVDDTKSRLEVDGAYAELSGLQVRTTKHAAGQMLRACYEFDGEWRVVSFSKKSWCSR